ncbi:spherulation-specific family 4 protein [Streptomyces polyrhachis]|uniref:Spherulation-specific family 4 protein n=1 Tax=Streptomyces polyrhachis TaxID=1282885 RepID=A0ABW2GGJ4_9ACTN
MRRPSVPALDGLPDIGRRPVPRRPPQSPAPRTPAHRRPLAAVGPAPGSLLVPMYVHPAVDPQPWRQLVRAAPGLYGVVLNVADGPGRAFDPAFAQACEPLRAAGVRVLGYADLAYGVRASGDVGRDMRRYREWYGAQGAFLDRAPSGADRLPGTRAMIRAARAEGARTVVLNPGVHPDPDYAQAADLLVTFEGTWQTYTQTPVPAWTRRHRAERFCHLVYGVPEGLHDLVARLARQRGAGVHCAVPGDGRNPWVSVPTG